LIAIIPVILIISTFTYYSIANVYAKELSTNYSQPIQIVYGIAPTETIITPKEIAKEQIQKIEPIQSTLKPKTIVRRAVSPQLAYNGSCYDYVDEMAGKYGVDAGLMRRIIKAESGGNPNAKNKNSTASGCGQFIKRTWEGTLRQMGREYVSPFDPKTNVEAMAFKISRGGIGAWNASKSKWSK
jgi:soluble lytic murein transglycosylase-like protein